jgi:hypothetical protein
VVKVNHAFLKFLILFSLLGLAICVPFEEIFLSDLGHFLLK